MSDFKWQQHNLAALSRVTPIAHVTDEQIWELLVTPDVKKILGKIKKSSVKIRQTTEGLFPGDEVSNLNDHRLYGGKTGFIRYPYSCSVYETEHGLFIVKVDGVKFEGLCWWGNYRKVQPELVLRVALKDRRWDGTPQANDSSLVDFTYDDPRFNKPLPYDCTSVEFSIYGFKPGTRLIEKDGDDEYERFVQNPFKFRNTPKRFRELFDRAYRSGRGPGQYAAPIDDVADLVLPAFEKLAQSYGYDFMELAPSHYNVAMWVKRHGYRYTYKKHARTMEKFARGIERVRQMYAADGVKLERPQESWLCVVQSLKPIVLIPDGLWLKGPIWPQNNIDQENLWMHKPLNERAKNLLGSGEK